MSKPKSTKAMLISAIHASADEIGFVKASSLRKSNRRAYEAAFLNSICWQEVAVNLGYKTHQNPRGTWNNRAAIIKLLKILYFKKGAPITRHDIIHFGYGSANSYIDKFFGNIQNAAKMADVPLSTMSGRYNGWANDDDTLKSILSEISSDFELPNAATVRSFDSGLESAVRKRFGSWQKGALYFGFSVPDSYQSWSSDTLIQEYQKTRCEFGSINLSDFHRIFSYGFKRAVQRRFGTISAFRKAAGEPSKKMLSPQGFYVESYGELLLSRLFFGLGISVKREEQKLPNGRTIIPDFIITKSEMPIHFVELLMIGAESNPQNERETRYQNRWNEKLEYYRKYDLPLTIINPEDLYNTKTLISKVREIKENTKNTDKAILDFERGMKFRSQPNWNTSKIKEEVLRISEKTNGFLPTQSQMKSLGKKGLVNSIYRSGLNNTSLERLCNLSRKPGLPRPPVPQTKHNIQHR